MWQPLGDPNVRCVAEGNAPRPMMVDGVVVLGHEERIKGWRMLARTVMVMFFCFKLLLGDDSPHVPDPMDPTGPQGLLDPRTTYE